MTDKEVMRMALDALNNFDKGNHGMRWQVPVIKALRTALAQPEPAECDGGQCGIGGYCKECPKPLVKLKEMLEMQGRDGTWNYDPYSQGMFNGMEFMVALAEGRDPVFREAPERWLHTPPQREWQGLTDEEIWSDGDSFVSSERGIKQFARAIEAKLKEKNT